MKLCQQEGCSEEATVVVGTGPKQVRMCDAHWNRAMKILGKAIRLLADQLP